MAPSARNGTPAPELHASARGGPAGRQRSAASGRSTAGRVLAGLALGLVLALGVLILGRLSRSTPVAISTTSAWFLLVAGAVLLAARRRRDLLVPLAAGYALVAVAAGLLLARPLVFDRVADERVTTPGAGSVAVARGDFRPIAHDGRGRATLVRLPSGEHRVTLTDFETDNGPDLRVHLTPGAPGDGASAGFVDLGELRGNRGDQEYAVPAGVDVARFGSVVVWCRAFSVGFTTAALTR